MVVGAVLVGVGVSAIALGAALLLNARRVGDRIRRRNIGHDRRLRAFAGENLDLIAAGIIMAGLAVGILGGLKIASEAYAMPQPSLPPRPSSSLPPTGLRRWAAEPEGVFISPWREFR